MGALVFAGENAGFGFDLGHEKLPVRKNLNRTVRSGLIYEPRCTMSRPNRSVQKI
jgi:hypothetical protein